MIKFLGALLLAITEINYIKCNDRSIQGSLRPIYASDFALQLCPAPKTILQKRIAKSDV